VRALHYWGTEKFWNISLFNHKKLRIDYFYLNACCIASQLVLQELSSGNICTLKQQTCELIDNLSKTTPKSREEYNTKEAKATEPNTSARERRIRFPKRSVRPSSSPSSCSQKHLRCWKNLFRHVKIIESASTSNVPQDGRMLLLEISLTVYVCETGGSKAFNFSKIRYTNAKAKNWRGLYSALRLIRIQAVCRKTSTTWEWNPTKNKESIIVIKDLKSIHIQQANTYNTTILPDGLIRITSATVSHLTRPSVIDIFGTPKTQY